MESFKEVWESVCQYCLQNKLIGELPFKVWIDCIQPVKLENDTAVLSVKTSFQKNIITEKYLSTLKTAFNEVFGFSIDIQVFSEEEENFSSPSPIPSSTDVVDLEKTFAGAEYEYTFETFIVGDSNKFANAACLAVAANPSGAYNPLFIYGNSGLGKTHLLYAICNEIHKNRPEKNTIYVKGEEFTNELINAIKQEKTTAFHDKYRQADVLLVDDIQFIGGKESTQEEFFHTFNSLYHSGKQIVLTSDRPPKEIKTLEERLRTRFEWGLLADVQPPDFETRMAIIRRKAELLDLDMPSEVCEYIANRLKTNIRQLEGTVKKLKAYKLLEGVNPTIAVAQNSIRDILNDNQPVEVTVERIITEVAKTFSVTAEDVRSKKRTSQISTARQVSIYVAREITQLPMTSLGEEFGGRDHTTVVYALQKIEKAMKKDAHFKDMVEDIIKNIREH